MEAQQTQPDPGGGPLSRLFVPDSARSQVLQWTHSDHLSCHPGVNHTLSLVKRHFWWPTSKSTHSLPAGLLRPSCRPWPHIAINFVTRLSPSRQYRNPHHCRPVLPSCSLCNRLNGIPQDIVFDHGPQFTSKEWQSFCQALGMSVRLTSGFHSQAN